MDNSLPALLSLVLLAIGVIWKFSPGSSAIRKSVALVAIGAFSLALVPMQVSFEADSSILCLAVVVLFSSFFIILSQDSSLPASGIYSSVLIILGLG